MGILNYTVAQINGLLGAAGTAVQPAEMTAAMTAAINGESSLRGAADEALSGQIGDLTDLSTTAQSDLVSAINELFTSASEGKSAIAAAITGRGIAAAASETFAALAAKITELSPAGYVDPTDYVQKRVTNAANITPTGTYATSTYYNTAYGVKIGYMENGDILLSMKGGTTTTYEYLQFTLASAPSGVTITAFDMGSDSSATGKAGVIYACVLSGVPVGSTLAVAMNARDATYDYITCAITVT